MPANHNINGIIATKTSALDFDKYAIKYIGRDNTR